MKPRPLHRPRPGKTHLAERLDLGWHAVCGATGKYGVEGVTLTVLHGRVTCKRCLRYV